MHFTKIGRASRAVAAGVAVLAASCAMPKAFADDIPSANVDRSIGFIRGGVVAPQNKRVQTTYGKTMPWGGIGYTIEQKPLVSRSSFSVDYEEESKSGANLRVIPIFLETVQYQHPTGSVRPYFEFGGGPCYVRIKDPSSTNPDVQNGKSNVVLGAEAGFGIDTSSHVFLEIRYQLIGEVASTNPSGPRADVGIRF